MYHQIWLISATSAASISSTVLDTMESPQASQPRCNTLGHKSAMNAADQLEHTPLPWAASLHQVLEFRPQQIKGDEVTSVR